MVKSSSGLRTKKDCAAEGQQQFTLPTDRPRSQWWVKNMVMRPAGPGSKNNCAVEGQQQFTQNRNTLLSVYLSVCLSPNFFFFVFCVVCDVSKENMRLGFPRNSCYFLPCLL
jgi:hypothetical protein